ncbi:MAG: protein kinase [Deltaproteobacteria bacterium]
MFVCPECGAAQAQAGACANDRTPLVPQGEELLLGTTIGPYRVARLIGIGGMGRVYKGVHPTIGSRVAIKVLSRECSDRRDLVERFFAEAKAVNVVAHENIVNVLDLATLPDGRPYIVMEYLDGSPLSSIIEQARTRGPLPLGSIARLVAEVLDALAAAHAKGVIHRDLKPDNIFVSPNGRGKVLDFGIAKLQPELGGSATHTGSLLGTPHYMSPEQAAGKSADARADVYAMGVILFECVTLHKPFSADSLFELLRKHIEAPPPLPRALRPDLPPELEAVILQALAKQPDQRFNSAHAMSLALQHATSRLGPEQWAAIVPVAQPNSGAWAPTPPASWSRQAVRSNAVTSPDPQPARSKAAWWIAGAVVLAGGGVTAAVLATSGGRTPAPADPAGSAVAQAPPASPGDAPAAIAQAGSDAWATQPPPPPPDRAGTPAKTDGTTAKPAKSDDDDTDEDLDDATGQLLAQLDQAKLPPNVRAAIKKYGAWAKIPAKERKKLALDIAGAAVDLTGDPDSTPTKPTKAAADDGPPTLSVPGWNAKHAEPDKLYDWAIVQAKKYRSDAQLTRIDIDNVFPDGHADLTLASFANSYGDVDIRFISPSHANHKSGERPARSTAEAGAKVDDKLPRGTTPQKAVCEFRVDLSPHETEIRDFFATPCTEVQVPRPRCSLAKVWKKALAQKPDLADAVASISYYSNPVSHRVLWFFTIYKPDHTSLFSEQYADDC